jgi:hypothetical protein
MEGIPTSNPHGWFIITIISVITIFALLTLSHQNGDVMGT